MGDISLCLSCIASAVDTKRADIVVLLADIHSEDDNGSGSGRVMIKVIRLFSSMLFGVVAMYLWLLVASGQMVIVAGTFTIGACLAAMIRSRWALVLLPLAVMIGLELWRATACSHCAVGDDTPFVAFMLSLPLYGGSALLGAALGTALVWRRADAP